MAVLRVASVCPLMKPADPEANLQTLERWATKAKEAGADLALFPETFISGYVTEEMCEKGVANKERFLATAEPIPGPTTDRVVELSRRLGVSLCAGMLERYDNKRFIT